MVKDEGFPRSLHHGLDHILDQKMSKNYLLLIPKGSGPFLILVIFIVMKMNVIINYYANSLLIMIIMIMIVRINYD